MNRFPIRDRRAMLRVKVNSLAAEARIIRREERRTRNLNLREELYRHRTRDVRSHARSASLALGFVRGRQYHEMEPTATSEPDWPEIKRLLAKYGPAGHVLVVDAERKATRLHAPLSVAA